jgi:hypothetical protein
LTGIIGLPLLAQAGPVDLRKKKDGRGKTIPSVKYDKILLEIQV